MEFSPVVLTIILEPLRPIKTKYPSRLADGKGIAGNSGGMLRALQGLLTPQVA
jgi:hypothetical protein